MTNMAEMSRRATELKDDPVIIEIFANLEARYINDWRSSQPADIQKRESAYARIAALEDIKGRLNSIANAPKVDAHNNRNAAKR